MADRAHGAVVRPARYRPDSRGFGTAIIHRLKPHLVRSTFDSCAIALKLEVCEAVQKCDQAVLFLNVESKRSQQRALVWIRPSTSVVKWNDLIKCAQASVVHIRTGDGDVAEGGSPKGAVVYRRQSHGAAAHVAVAIEVESNASIAKCEVG